MSQGFDAAKLRFTGDAFTVVEKILYFATGTAAFSSGNGTLVYRTNSETTRRQLEWLDRSGESLGTLGPVRAYRNPELSPDGKRVAVEETDPQTRNDDIYVIDAGGETRLTFDPGLDISPIWSPNGEQI